MSEKNVTQTDNVAEPDTKGEKKKTSTQRKPREPKAEPTKPLTTRQRIIKICEKIAPVAKESLVNDHGTSFNGRTIEGVLEALNPLLTQYGLNITVAKTESSTQILTTQQGLLYFGEVKNDYVIYNNETDDVETGQMSCGATSYDANHIQSAMTGAYKYFLLQTFRLQKNDTDVDAKIVLTTAPQGYVEPPAQPVPPVFPPAQQEPAAPAAQPVQEALPQEPPKIILPPSADELAASLLKTQRKELKTFLLNPTAKNPETGELEPVNITRNICEKFGLPEQDDLGPIKPLVAEKLEHLDIDTIKSHIAFFQQAAKLKLENMLTNKEIDASQLLDGEF